MTPEAITIPIQRLNDIVRIGVITEPLGDQDSESLRFLILHLNTLQQSFEFELLPSPPNDSFFAVLNASIGGKVDRQFVRSKMQDFLTRVQDFVKNENRICGCTEPPPQKLVILTTVRFHDNFYSARMPDDKPNCAIIALGDWERNMTPPTLLEFFLVLLLRQAVALTIPELGGSVHIGTKGCLFDFNKNLHEVRYKVLNGFVCSYCTAIMKEVCSKKECSPNLHQELVKLLKKEWLRTSNQPTSASSISAKLGHNLFITKGLKPTLWENIISNLQLEGVKQFFSTYRYYICSYNTFYNWYKACGETLNPVLENSWETA